MHKQVLEKLIESTEEQHKAKPISPEAYNRWRTSGVTKRMMEELELRLIDILIAEPALTDNDFIVRDTIVVRTSKAVIEDVLNWKPQELLSDED